MLARSLNIVALVALLSSTVAARCVPQGQQSQSNKAALNTSPNSNTPLKAAANPNSGTNPASNLGSSSNTTLDTAGDNSSSNPNSNINSGTNTASNSGDTNSNDNSGNNPAGNSGSSPDTGSNINPSSPDTGSTTNPNGNQNGNAAPSSVLNPGAASTSSPASAPNTNPSSVPTQSNSSPNTASFTSSQPATKMCGDNQNIILSGTPWLVANSMYGSGSMVGTSCTSYDHIGGSNVVWSNEVHIQNIQATDNICKGYANVGITGAPGGVGSTVASITSAPATYDWTRTSTSNFKGNICFDFILGPKGDSTSTAAQELMLWLEWEGGQLPIGWDGGAVATIPNLFGTSWKLYEGVNTGNGMTVHSMLPDTQFSGSFSGDLKDWFEALVKLNKFQDSAYVNVGNAGSEIFWGDSVLQAQLGVQINTS